MAMHMWLILYFFHALFEDEPFDNEINLTEQLYVMANLHQPYNVALNMETWERYEFVQQYIRQNQVKDSTT